MKAEKPLPAAWRLAGLLTLAAACLSPTPPTHAQAPDEWKADPVELTQSLKAVLARGKASWYGPRFHGRRTASGERFDQNELTAAHPTLPFGTMVRVRNVANGREVVVRINDRLPSRRRIIDLSKAAAVSLGFLNAGLAPVVLIQH
ncbi:septal ring lytic transglycosylase RlpA family protein [Caenimonas sedimenti]|uniref:Endolytic peptidoglycan transglycosylase RlpA n=1 Tax=Caenimonas sedimenti TaxID=2596921 RepID=A0A562ZER7_9BURK|nr:septal ring lytic transglycosylase RlpA family protein [Caenimonas sedimenti]